jgi:O-antigen chain-terminating methyltransferase
MSGDERAATAGPPFDDGPPESLYRRLAGALGRLTPWGLNRRIAEAETALAARIDAVERRLDVTETALRTIQDEVSALRDERLAPAETRIDRVEGAVHDLSGETVRLRDRVVPAAAARTDAVMDRFAEELEEVGSLVERSLRREPLPVPAAESDVESRVARGLSHVQPLLLEAFRGAEEEIHHRLDIYLPDLRKSGPVLDLGCGRGELLLMLRDDGVEAIGVDGDAALAGSARRRGLEVLEGDVLEVLRTLGEGSQGAVTALHLFEHLAPDVLAAVLAEARRVLRPGGLLIAECPNPHSLRVGGALFWQDPTHRRPLLPETLELFLRSAGFAVERVETLHPFPPDQLLMDDEGGTGAVTDADMTTLAERVDRLRRRLDDLLNGSRDFAVWAVKPDD